MSTTPDHRRRGNWARLAREVHDRRQWLQLSQTGMSRVGGPSHETVRLIENQGRPAFRDLTLSQLDRALQWRPGIANEIVFGDPPADRRKWEADLSIDEVAAQAQALRASKNPAGMKVLPVSLDNVSDLELAGELVSRLTRGRSAGEHRVLLAELMGLLGRLSEDDSRTA